MMSRCQFAYIVFLLVCSVPVRASKESSQLPVHSSQSTAEHQLTTDNRPLPTDNACVSCHVNLTGKLGAVVQEWAQSVHFRNKVTCDGCHGGDPAVKREQCADDEAFKNRSHQHRTRELSLVNRPEEQFTSTARGRSVSYFCGKCHEQIKEKHLGSPHGDLGNPTCLYCHAQGPGCATPNAPLGTPSHAIMESKVDIIDLRPLSQGGRCAVCHRAATMETVAQIYKSLVNAETQLKSASEQYSRLETFGYKNLALQKMYGHTRETLSQLRRSFHSFNMREINEAASTIRTSAQLTQDTYDMIQALEGVKGRQAFVGIGAVAFLLSFAGLLLVYRHRYLH